MDPRARLDYDLSMGLKRWGLIVVVSEAIACGGAARTEPVAPSSEARPTPMDVTPCAKGDGESCLAIGIAYLDGTGVAKDLRKGAEYVRKACDANNAVGCGYAAELIFNDEGNVGDVAEGYRLRVKACRGLHSLSCNNLGSAWANGSQGASKVDFVKAKTYYQMACHLKNPVGCFNIGNAYRLGEGVDADIQMAMTNFDLSCDLGGPQGCTELAILYYEGTDTPQDTAKAAALFDKGCKLGSDVSCQNYRTVRSQTTSNSDAPGRARP